MRISIQLIAGFMGIAALVALVGLFSHLANQSVQQQVEQLSRSSMVEVVGATEMAIALDDAYLELRELLLPSSQREAEPGEFKLDASALHRSTQSITAALDQFERSLERSRQAGEGLFKSAERSGNFELAAKLHDTVRPRLRELAAAVRGHRGRVDQCLALAESDLPAALSRFESQVVPDYQLNLRPMVLAEKRGAEQDFNGEIRGAQRAIAEADSQNTALTLLALLFALALGLVISRSIGRPLAQLQQAALRIGKGQLSARADIRRSDEIGVLASTIDQMAADLESTTVSKSYVDNILRSMREMVVVVDPQWNIQKVNAAVLTELDYTEPQLLARPLVDLFADPNELPRAGDDLPDRRQGSHQAELLSSQGARVPVLFSFAELRSEDGQLQGMVLGALNIAERRLAEQRLHASLHEKEVLLREVHHRVKNNLQVICSLLSLQSRDAADPRAARLFEECQGRIRSMALIHEQLYQSAQLARIDFAEYAQRLCDHLAKSIGPRGEHIALRLDVDPMPLSLNQAIPCGMILNELISNAIKHAFPDGQGGEIYVGFFADGPRRRLIVRDNGVGMPTEPAAGRTSLGLKVVDALVCQLGGRLESEVGDGTQFALEFAETLDGPLPAAETAVPESRSQSGLRRVAAAAASSQPAAVTAATP